MASGYPLRAIVGLGNPGSEHAAQRHNIGFWWVDALAASQRVVFRAEHKFQGEIAMVTIGGHSLLLLKPLTYMNKSGVSVQALSAFYKLDPAELLIVHDELDLPIGSARIKRGGGHGGHNGLRSVTAHLGEGYCRLRLGIGHPGHKDRVIGYVLARASSDQQTLLDSAVQHSLALLPTLLSQGWDKTAQLLHTEQKG